MDIGDEIDGIEITQEEAFSLLPILNTIQVDPDMLRLAVLYSDGVQHIPNRVERFFFAEDQAQWKALSKNQQRAADWRVTFAMELETALREEDIGDVALEELQQLTLTLPLRSIEVEDRVGDRVVVGLLPENSLVPA